MAKDVVQFVCQACGAVTPRWVGRCNQCSAWNTIVEEISRKKSSGKIGGSLPVAKAQLVSEIDADHAARVPTEIAELDRVLGGGVVLGGVVLVGGDPGVGKSTLLLQALSALSAKGCRALYVSGEESAGQTAARARRLGVLSDDLLVLAENDLDAVERAIEDTKPAVLVIDSVQTVRSPDLESAAGSVSQLREVAARIVDRAKRSRIAAFLVGHVTKDGSLAGPKVLEHLVDTVLAFEGERGHSLRTLRAHKNRFGSATEVGVFEMTADGMRQVPNASAFFLSERPKNVAGSIVAATSEGTRSMLVEVQALTVVQSSGSPRRTVSGVDGARLAMILAVLERKSGLHVSGCDVFVNVAGGVHVDEPAMDLPIALAVASSLKDRPIHPEIVAFGEIGLSGEVRAVPRAEARIAEAAALGFRRAILPASVAEKFTKDAKTELRAGAHMELMAVRSLDEALATAM
jgi:DNA repair protein RadA/Sms